MGDVLKSIYKGVHFNKRSGLWASSVTIKGERHWCGSYKEERSAAKARDKYILTMNLNIKTQVLSR